MAAICFFVFLFLAFLAIHEKAAKTKNVGSLSGVGGRGPGFFGSRGFGDRFVPEGDPSAVFFVFLSSHEIAAPKTSGV